MKTFPQQRWLRCQLDRGMFSDESVVTYPSHGAPLASVFVPSVNVRGHPGGLGLVHVVVTNPGGQLMATLPTSYGECVAVSEVDLEDAP